MALHNGIDTVAVASFGVYTKTYGSGDSGNIANLFVSFGLLEDAPSSTAVVTPEERAFGPLEENRIFSILKEDRVF